MSKYSVTLPEDSSLTHRRLDGVGLLLRGKPQKLELSSAQVASLKARGIDIEPLSKPKKKSADDESSGKENG